MRKPRKRNYNRRKSRRSKKFWQVKFGGVKKPKKGKRGQSQNKPNCSVAKDPKCTKGVTITARIDFIGPKVLDSVGDIATKNTSTPATQVRMDSDRNDDDVVYLYNVNNNSSDRIFPEIDLTNDTQNHKGSSMHQSPEPSKDKTKNPTIPRKRKSNKTGETSKKAENDQTEPRCMICCRNLDCLHDKGYICITKCNHIFCDSCISGKTDENICRECGRNMGSLRKLYK